MRLHRDYSFDAACEDVYALLTDEAFQAEMSALVAPADAIFLNAQLESEVAELDEDEARDILREAPGVMVIDKREPGGYVTPIECVGDFATFVSRIRQDPTVENGLNLWCVSDNLRKGAALNAVQIAELLGNRVLKKG